MYCKDCDHWGEDASQLCNSARMKVCNGLTTEWEPRPGFTDGTRILTENSALTEEIEVCSCQSFDPKFMTGPVFGCVNFKDKQYNGKGDWVSERSSGYPGNRCRKCATWILSGLKLKCECDNV